MAEQCRGEATPAGSPAQEQGEAVHLCGGVSGEEEWIVLSTFTISVDHNKLKSVFHSKSWIVDLDLLVLRPDPGLSQTKKGLVTRA